MVGVSKVSAWLFGMVISPELNRYAASWSLPCGADRDRARARGLLEERRRIGEAVDRAGRIGAEIDAAVVLDVGDAGADVEHAEAVEADEDVAAEGDGAGGVLDVDVAGAGAGVGDVEIAHDGGVGPVEDGQFARAGVADGDGACRDQIGVGAGDGDDAGAAGLDADIQRGGGDSRPVGDGKHAGVGVADIKGASNLPLGARTRDIHRRPAGAGLVGDDGACGTGHRRGLHQSLISRSAAIGCANDHTVRRGQARAQDPRCQAPLPPNSRDTTAPDPVMTPPLLSNSAVSDRVRRQYRRIEARRRVVPVGRVGEIRVAGTRPVQRSGWQNNRSGHGQDVCGQNPQITAAVGSVREQRDRLAERTLSRRRKTYRFATDHIARCDGRERRETN